MNKSKSEIITAFWQAAKKESTLKHDDFDKLLLQILTPLGLITGELATEVKEIEQNPQNASTLFFANVLQNTQNPAETMQENYILIKNAELLSTIKVQERMRFITPIFIFTDQIISFQLTYAHERHAQV